MKRLGWFGLAAAGLLAAIVVALVALPYFLPTEAYRQRIESAATQAIGRPVRLEGDIRLSVFPRIEARASAASIANPEGFDDRPFAAIKELRAAVKLWPLLSRRVEVDAFVLVEPDIALVVLADGRNNWTFKSAPPAAPQPDKPAASVGASLGDIRIRKGAISWEDRGAGVRHAFTELEVRADMAALSQPLNLKAEGLANSVRFTFGGQIANPEAMLNGTATAVDAALSTELLTTNLKGDVALGAEPVYDLAFDGEIPNAPKLADAFKVEDLPAREALGLIAMSGRLTGRPGDIQLAVESARHESETLRADFKGSVRLAEAITLDLVANADAPQLAKLAGILKIEAPGPEVLGAAKASARVKGQLGDLRFSEVSFAHDSNLLNIGFEGAARLSGALSYDGTFRIAAPDLRKLAEATKTALPPGEIYRTFSLSGRTAGGGDSMLLKDAVLEFDGIRGTGEAALTFGGERPRLVGTLRTGAIDVTPYALASGAPKDENPKAWQTTPVDLGPLRLADASLRLSAEGLRYQKLDFGPTTLDLELKGGRLQADLSQTSLFDGSGALSVVADGSGDTPKVALKARISGLQLDPLLGAVARFDRLKGQGDIVVDLAAGGDTVAALMASLTGDGGVLVRNGAIEGVDLVQLVNVARSAAAEQRIPLSAFGNNARTSFKDLAATFTARDGIARMADLSVDAGILKVTGEGSLDLGKQTLSLSLNPRFTDKTKGMNGFGLPLKLSGGWSGVEVALDFKGLMAAARSNVTATVEREARRKVEEQLARPLGLGRPAGTTAAPTGAEGTGQTEEAPPAAEAATPAPAPAPAASPVPAAPRSAEDQLKDAARDRLQDLLRR